MKKLVSMLLASVMTFSTFGMVAFADDGQQAATAGSKAVATQSSRNVRDLVALSKKSFEYDFTKGKLAGKDKKRHYASVSAVLNSITRTDAGSSVGFSVNSDATYKIGNTTYQYDDKSNSKRTLNPGKYTLTVTAKAPYSGSVESPFEVTPYKVSKNDVDVWFGNTYYHYTGKKHCPKVTKVEVLYGDDYESVTLKKGTDYTVSSYKYKNNKNYGYNGRATATIKFKGKYSGTATGMTEIYITPRGVKIKSAKAGKKSVKVKWKRSKEATGYTVGVETPSGKFVKARTIKGNKKTSCTIKGLKRHKKYSVYVAPYKKVKGKTVSTTKDDTKWKNFRTK